MDPTSPLLGFILTLVGILMITVSAGALFYSLWPRSKKQ